MRTQKRHVLLSFLLIFSLLISPFSGVSIKANAEEGEGGNETQPPSYTGLSLKLSDTSGSDNTFYAANGILSENYILDYSDIVITATYKDGDVDKQVILDPAKTKGLTLNLQTVSKTVGNDQELTASLSFETTGGYQTLIANKGGENPKVTILESKETVRTVKLKLKDPVKDKTFYEANNVLDADDTLDAEDLELTYSYEIRSFTDKYFDDTVTDESEKYIITSYASDPISLVTGQTQYTINDMSYNITTNVDEVRKTVKADQELTAVLSYADKDAEGNDITVEVNSTDNPKVTIIKPNSTMKLKSIAIAITENSKNKKFYVDNGYMTANDILSDNDLDLTLTYENGKTDTMNIGTIESDEFTVKTDVNTVKKVIFYNKKSTPQAQDVTATLTYKDEAGTEKTLSASTKVTVIAPKAVNGVVTIEPQNIYYGSTGSNKNGVNATDNKNDKFDIQCALDMAAAEHKLVVHFPAGNYYLSNSLYIHSNTTLKFDTGATLVRNSNSDAGVAAGTTDRLGVNHNILKIAPYNTTTPSTVGGYSNENITIEGGTFDGGIISAATDAANLLNLGHASNITIKNATFRNCYGNHLIELCAVQNAEISGCTFTGFRYVTSQITDGDGTVSYADASGDLAEAIQIDVAHKDSKSAWTSAYKADDTACANISIHDNTFTDYPVAIGNHHALAGHHHSNITIFNNTITGTKAMNSGIKLYGCDNSTAKNNTITNYATGIKAAASTGFTITENNVSSATYGIIATESSQGQIVSNALSSMVNEGIIVYGGGTTADSVSNNIVTGSSKHGIIVHTSATCTALTNNTITGCASDGIEVYGSASAPSVKSNTITSCGANGIYVYSSAVATTIKSNKISDCNKYGVYVTGKASVKTLSSNTIKNIKKNGIYVKNDKIKVTFKSNKLTRVGSTAIKIDSKLASKKTQKYTFAPKVISLNLKGGVMTTQASNLKKIKLKVGSKSYTKSTKKKNYTFKFKKYKKAASSATVTFTDKNKNTVARVLDFN